MSFKSEETLKPECKLQYFLCRYLNFFVEYTIDNSILMYKIVYFSMVFNVYIWRCLCGCNVCGCKSLF